MIASPTTGRRTTKRLIAAALFALLLTGVAATTRLAASHRAQPTTIAGNSWSRMMVLPEPDSNAWS